MWGKSQKKFLTIVFLVLVAFVSIRTISSVDLGYQLKFGQLFLSGELPQTDPFTFGAMGNPYICLNTLFSLLMLFLNLVGGEKLLSLYTLVMSLLIFGTLLYFGYKKKINWLLLIAVLTFGLWLVEYRIDHKSELMAVWFSLLSYGLLTKYVSSKEKKYLYPLPILQFLWVNTHAFFVWNWLIIGAFLIANYRSKKSVKELGITLLVVVLLSFLNPYGWRGAIFPFQSLGLVSGSSYFGETIHEYYSLPTALYKGSDPHMSSGFLFYILLILIVYIKNKKKVKTQDAIIFGVGSVLCLMANRIIFFVVPITLIPWAINLQQLIKDKNWLKKSTRKWLNKYGSVIYLLVVIIWIYAIVTGKYYGGWLTRFGIGMNYYNLPIESAEFIKKNDLQGRIFNTVDFGGWLIWKQNNLVYIDDHTEVMGEKLHQEYVNTVRDGQLQKVIDKYDVEILALRILSTPSTTPILVQAEQLEDFRLVSLDQTTAIYTTAEEASRSGAPEFDWETMLVQNGVQVEWGEEEFEKFWQVEKRYDFSAWQMPEAIYPFHLETLRAWAQLAIIQGDLGTALTIYLNLWAYEMHYNTQTAEVIYALFQELGLEDLAMAWTTNVRDIYKDEFGSP